MAKINTEFKTWCLQKLINSKKKTTLTSYI